MITGDPPAANFGAGARFMEDKRRCMNEHVRVRLRLNENGSRGGGEKKKTLMVKNAAAVRACDCGLKLYQH